MFKFDKRKIEGPVEPKLKVSWAFLPARDFNIRWIGNMAVRSKLTTMDWTDEYFDYDETLFNSCLMALCCYSLVGHKDPNKIISLTLSLQYQNVLARVLSEKRVLKAEHWKVHPFIFPGGFQPGVITQNGIRVVKALQVVDEITGITFPFVIGNDEYPVIDIGSVALERIINGHHLYVDPREWQKTQPVENDQIAATPVVDTEDNPTHIKELDKLSDM